MARRTKRLTEVTQQLLMGGFLQEKTSLLSIVSRYLSFKFPPFSTRSFARTKQQQKRFVIIRDALSYSSTKHNLAALLEQENLITCSVHWWGKHRKYTGEVSFNAATGKHCSHCSSLAMLGLLVATGYIIIIQY